jgi:hypothetical protein
MKKIDAEKAISIIANFGVIGGPIFLAVEMNQNSAQLASQARFNY